MDGLHGDDDWWTRTNRAAEAERCLNRNSQRMGNQMFEAELNRFIENGGEWTRLSQDVRERARKSR